MSFRPLVTVYQTICAGGCFNWLPNSAGVDLIFPLTTVARPMAKCYSYLRRVWNER